MTVTVLWLNVNIKESVMMDRTTAGRTDLIPVDEIHRQAQHESGD